MTRYRLLDAFGWASCISQSAGQPPGPRTHEVAASRRCTPLLQLLRRLIVTAQQIAHQVRLWLRLQQGNVVSKVSKRRLLV
jgi:hypothetical protein